MHQQEVMLVVMPRNHWGTLMLLCCPLQHLDIEAQHRPYVCIDVYGCIAW
jgi:hypothetical protein